MMELDIFFARFHPLIVHLPIGFLVLGAVLELIDRFGGSPGQYRKSILWVLGLTVLSGALAILTGLLLEGNGEHGGSTLQLHKILGISLVVVAAVLFVAKAIGAEYRRQWSLVAIVVLVGLLSATGHLGGELTHGKTYLSEYAPPLVKPLLGGELEPSVDLTNLHPDSVLVYAHVIQPILEDKCARCHNSSEPRGGLDLSDFSSMFDEGESGTALIAGNATASEIFRRVTLPPSHSKYMPPSGDPLSYGEISLVKWWINQGADSLQRFGSDIMEDEMITLVLRDYQKDYSPRPYYERVVVDPAQAEILDKMRANGYTVRALGEKNHLLDVAFQGPQMEAEHHNLLKQVAPKITFLDLSDTQIPQEIFMQIREMEHLTRLDLHASSVQDEDLEALLELQHLEALNLYNTAITDEGLKALENLGSLQRIYLWQTQTSTEYLAALDDARPDLQVIKGFE